MLRNVALHSSLPAETCFVYCFTCTHTHTVYYEFRICIYIYMYIYVAKFIIQTVAGEAA